MILSEEKRKSLAEDANKLLQDAEKLISKLQLTEGLQKLQICMNDFELLEDYHNLMRCHLMSAGCYYNLGNVKLSFELINQYESLCEKYKVPVDKAEYYPLLGIIYMYKGEYEKAIHFYDKAAPYALQSKNYRRYITAKKHIAYVTSMTKQYELGLNAVYDAVPYLYYLDEEDVNQIEIYIVEAILYIEMKRYTDAKRILEFIGRHPILPLDQVTHSLYMQHYARYLLEVEDYQKAYEYANKGLELLANQNQFVSEHELFELLIEICKNLNDSEKTILTYERYVESLKLSKDQSFEKELSKRDLEDMKKLTEIDSLTGIFNRKYLTDKASEWMNLAPMNKESIFCCVFDIDHFKQINDKYGHLMGDEILKELATQCLAIIEKARMDIFLARYGGDEFVLVSRNTSVENEIESIKKLYQDLNGTTYIVDSKEFNLNISMGLAYTNPGEYKDFKDLFKLADEALYMSKENGRNILSIYEKNSLT